MSNKFWAAVWCAVLLFVWYDGVKHGYQMAITDLGTGSASAGTARVSSPSLRL
jgi:hypothetical protein